MAKLLYLILEFQFLSGCKLYNRYLPNRYLPNRYLPVRLCVKTLFDSAGVFFCCLKIHFNLQRKSVQANSDHFLSLLKFDNSLLSLLSLFFKCDVI